MALAARPRLDVLRHRPQLVLPAVLVQQLLAVAVAHLRHVRRLAEVADLAVDAFDAGGVASLPLAHETVRDGEADEDCEAGADDDEEGDEHAVQRWRFVGCLAGHCEGLVRWGVGEWGLRGVSLTC